MKQSYLLALAIFLISFGLGMTVGQAVLHPSCGSSYKYIDPNLRCSGDKIEPKKEFTVAEDKISAYFDTETQAGHLTRGSVFFRDLDNGPTFGVNSSAEFVPASLLKVPLMITYLRLAESDPTLLSRKLAFDLDNVPVQVQHFPPSHTIEKGDAYSVQELLQNMVSYSDNNSYYLLSTYLAKLDPDSDELLQTYRDLGIIEPGNDTDETISTRDYASIFRDLYSASYLTKQYSELALSMLDAADFDGGLVAGVGQDVTVAHKFGERSDLSNGLKQLHDCGIIYDPKDPYLLCVMTEGQDFDNLLGVIKSVSQMVSNEVNSR